MAIQYNLKYFRTLSLLASPKWWLRLIPVPVLTANFHFLHPFPAKNCISRPPSARITELRRFIVSACGLLSSLWSHHFERKGAMPTELAMLAVLGGWYPTVKRYLEYLAYTWDIFGQIWHRTHFTRGILITPPWENYDALRYDLKNFHKCLGQQITQWPQILTLYGP